MKNCVNKVLSLVLSLAVVLGLFSFPIGVFALEGTPANQVTVAPIQNYTVKRSGAFGNRVYPIDGCDLFGESFDRNIKWYVSQKEFTSVSSCTLQFLDINSETKNTNGYVFYLSVPKGTTTTFNMIINDPNNDRRWGYDYPPILSPLSDEVFYYLPFGKTEWKSENFVCTNNNNIRYEAGIYFESGFTGYIKIPYASLGNDSGFVFNKRLDSLNSIVFKFNHFGGEFGEVIAGPNFLIKEDGTSGIALAEEYKKPAENTGYQIKDYTLFHGSAIASANADSVTNNGFEIKGRTVDSDTLFEYSSNSEVGPQYVSNMSLYYENTDLSGDGFIFYLKLPAANFVVFEAVLDKPDSSLWTFEYYPELSIYEGEKCFVLPKGDNYWQEKTASKGSQNSFRGGLEFDSAFEGYVKIPYSALRNDSGLVFPFENPSLYALNIKFKRVGGDYGEIFVSDYYILQNSTDSEKVDLIPGGDIEIADTDNGSVTVEKEFVRTGEKVEVKVNPNEGYTLKSNGLYAEYTDFSGENRLDISEYDENSGSFKFTMPKTCKVTLNARFVPINGQNFAVLGAEFRNDREMEFILREFNNSLDISQRGVLIALSKSLNGNALTKDLRGTDIIDVTLANSDNSFDIGGGKRYYDYKVRLTDIKTENFAEDYIVRGYYVIDGQYFYTDCITANCKKSSQPSPRYELFPEMHLNGSYYGISLSYSDTPWRENTLKKGIKASAETLCDLSVNEVQGSPYWFRTNFEETELSDYNYIGMYVKVPSAKENCLYMDFASSDGNYFKLTSGYEYCLINTKTGDSEYRVISEGADKYKGVITIPAGFDGLIYFPVKAINPRNSISEDVGLSEIVYRFGYLGNGDSAVTVGPIIGFKQTERNYAKTDYVSSFDDGLSPLKINEDLTEMSGDTAVFYWDNYNGAENYLLKAYGRVIGGYKCLSENTLYSNSGSLGGLIKDGEYIITLSARDSKDNVLYEYPFENISFEPSESNFVKPEEIEYDTVDYSGGNVENSPFVERSYTPLTAGNSYLLNYNPNRGFRGCINFFRFNLTDSEIRAEIDYNIGLMKNNGVETSAYVCYIYPGDYISGDLSSEFFTCLENIFGYCREKNIQLLLRFAYFDENNFNQRTPTTAEILRHIDQISDNGIIEDNKDILHAFQVGFIGKYGEWHSDTPANTSADRSSVLNAFVEKLLPSGVYAQLRMPNYKDFLSADNSTEYGGRIGFHQDSFYGIMDGSEIGSGQYSYGCAEWDRHIAEAYCVPNDAETYYWQQFDDLGAYPEGYGSAIAASQLRLTTFSAVNGYLDQSINASGCMDEWKKLPVTKKWLTYNNLPFSSGWFVDNEKLNVSRNVFEYIRDYLGYRISAKNLSVSETQSGMNVSLNLVNYGFSAAFNIKSELVILDEENNTVSSEQVGSPEKWYGTTGGYKPDSNLITYNVSADFDLPNRNGNYKIALLLYSKSGPTARMDNNIPYESGYNILHTFSIQNGD